METSIRIKYELCSKLQIKRGFYNFCIFIDCCITSVLTYPATNVDPVFTLFTIIFAGANRSGLIL